MSAGRDGARGGSRVKLACWIRRRKAGHTESGKSFNLKGLRMKTGKTEMESHFERGRKNEKLSER